MNMQSFLIELIATGEDEADLIELSEDLAWEAVMNASRAEGIDVGSDDFVAAFSYLKSRYAECAQHFGHLTYMATNTLRALMDSGMAIVYPSHLPADDESVTRFINNLVGLILSVSTSIYSVGPTGWIPNEQWDTMPEDQRTTTFTFIRNNTTLENNVYND